MGFDEAYLSSLDKRIEAISEALSNGSASDHAAYMADCGRIRGLREARREYVDLLNRTNSEE